MLLELFSTLSTGLFAGAAIYINIVEHPARLQCGAHLAVPEFGSSYRRGAVLMGCLLTCSFSSALAVGLMSARLGWFIGGILLFCLLPFTLIMVMPINRQLLDPTVNEDAALATRLLRRWGRLHAVRSLLGLTAFLLFVYLLPGEASR